MRIAIQDYSSPAATRPCMCWLRTAYGSEESRREEIAHTTKEGRDPLDGSTHIDRGRYRGIIWGMYVPREMRGKGIGKALLEAAIAYAKTLPGLEQINVSVVITSKEAHRLFQLLGFETYGLERHALKLNNKYFDQELMTLWLTPTENIP